MLDSDPARISNQSENLSELEGPETKSAIGRLNLLKQVLDERIAKLPEKKTGFIDESLAVLQLRNAVKEKARDLSYEAKTRAERKAAESVKDEVDDYKRETELAAITVSNKRSLELLKRLQEEPRLLNDRLALLFVGTVIELLVREACKNPSAEKLEAFKTGIACAECIYERGQKLGDLGKKSQPDEIDGPELLSRYYRILRCFRFEDNIPDAVRKLMQPIAVRALTEHEGYLKTLAGSDHRVVDNQETVAVFRVYFLADFIDLSGIYCDLVTKAPGFAIHLAACGGSVNSEEYAAALAEALCRVGDWIWKCWHNEAEYSEDPEGEFESAIYSAAVHLSKRFGQNFQGTVREVGRLLNRTEPGATLAKEKYRRKKKESYHDVIIETFENSLDL